MAERLKAAKFKLILIGAIAAAAALAGVVLDAYWIGVLSQALMMGLAAVALDVLVGWSGMPSLGHAAFFGVAGYTVAIMITRWDINPWLAAVLGVVLGLLLASGFAPLAVRTHGLAFLTVTLAFGQVIWGLATKWYGVTGGSDGIAGVPRPESLFGLSLYDPKVFYVFTIIVVAGFAGLLLWVMSSPFGLQLRGVRLSELRLRSLGYNSTRLRMAAFILSAGLVSVAGVMFTFFNQFVGTNAVDWRLSAQMLLAVIVGGPGKIWGPFVAGCGLFIIQVFATNLTDRWTLILGLLYIGTVLFLPTGIAGLFKREGGPNQGGGVTEADMATEVGA